ncbi:MAG: diaminopropionate ammonia-lyase [Lachnospiraceae bacterium]|nr:diaminopropionate ammonia-lyase [Lachnospiraceae bacterium]
MKQYLSKELDVLAQQPEICASSLPFTGIEARETLRFHRSLPLYRETALLSLSAAAARYGTGGIYVKDESTRFGLKAFKGLGGSYSMFRILCEKLGLDPRTASYPDFLREEIRGRCRRIEFATATDGNHGKGVSWAAKLFGCRAHVFMPKGTVEARRRAIEEAGNAEALITDVNYDKTVQLAASLAEQNGWILIQDTSWPGYEKIPHWIMEGYLTLAAEAEKQLGGKEPTHIFLQAGVGAMAGSLASYFLSRAADRKPLITVVEPKAAACFYVSAQAEDGKAHSIEGNPVTIMAGLNCGTPCESVWPLLRDGSAFFAACDDRITEDGMRTYANPLGADPAVKAGESGAVSYGLLLKILQSPELRSFFRIDRDSVILLVNTEGDTDPENYKRIVGE